MKPKILITFITTAITIGVLGVVLGFFNPFSPEIDMPAVEGNSPAQDARQPLYWVAPMDANYRRDEPGFSVMGMALIPVYEGGDTITVSSSIQQNLGVRTAAVRVEDFSPIIAAVGTIGWDESSIQILHTRAEGWIEVFNLESVGDRVIAGDTIYELFAPRLVSAQREYTTALQSNNASLVALARDRLTAFGFTPRQINQLNQSRAISARLIVRADRDAIVTNINVREGNYVEPSTPIATLASLERVWIEAEVFETDAIWIESGLAATISFPAFPGEMWSSEVAYVYPELNLVTRSLRLRLIVENKEQRLKPNMFANVQISSIPRLNVLTVPREAVIRSGQGDRVILSLGAGQFKPQVVQTGVSSGSRIEIVGGLVEGDVVVTSGQFLLDSEANGEQAFARLMLAETGVSQTESGMDMTVLSISEMDEAEVYSTNGEITQIVSGETVTISHEAVTPLDWPAMVMGFRLPPDLDMSEFAVNDNVTFEFTAMPSGMYRITNIRLRDAPQ